MTPEAQLRKFIAKYTPEIAELLTAAVQELTERIPSATRLVYDNYNALVIGFGPSERASEAILSLAAYARHVNLCFLQAGKVKLPDPRKLLQGSGTTNRFVTLESAASLEDADISRLIDQALQRAKVPLEPDRTGQLIIKSVAEKQRPRRPPIKQS